jgi:multidrug efflux pump subunit AcrB
MNETTRTVLIALGVTLLVIVFVPLLFMAGMMGGMMNGGAGWIMGSLVVLVLVAGTVAIAIGIGQRR